jgi:hypothetical protein
MPISYAADRMIAVVEAINAGLARLRGVPEGAWSCRIEITGDGVSPYAASGGASDPRMAGTPTAAARGSADA